VGWQQKVASLDFGARSNRDIFSRNKRKEEKESLLAEKCSVYEKTL